MHEEARGLLWQRGEGRSDPNDRRRGQTSGGQRPERHRRELTPRPDVGRDERAKALGTAIGGIGQRGSRRQRRLNPRDRAGQHQTKLTNAQVQQPTLVAVIHRMRCQRQCPRHGESHQERGNRHPRRPPRPSRARARRRLRRRGRPLQFRGNVTSGHSPGRYAHRAGPRERICGPS